jgi:hypothetical protein
MNYKLNYSNVKSRQDVNTWLRESTQTVKSINPFIFTEDNNKWIEQYSVKIGFHTLVILKLNQDNNTFACHTVEHTFDQPFPNIGKFSSYENIITSLTDLYTEIWKLEK